MKDEHKNEEGKNDKTYVCAGCSSESTGTPGTCCGGERKEK